MVDGASVLGLASDLSLLSALAVAPVFLLWFTRAYGALSAIGAARRHRASWALGAWFIPLVNLVAPVRVAREIWRGTRADRGVAVPSAWWLLLVAGVTAGLTGSRAYERSSDIDGLIAANRLIIAADLAMAIAALLAIHMVASVTRAIAQADPQGAGERPTAE